jgi:hypothetical protein
MRCTWLGAAAGLGVVKMQLLSREVLQFAGQGDYRENCQWTWSLSGRTMTVPC